MADDRDTEAALVPIDPNVPNARARTIRATAQVIRRAALEKAQQARKYRKPAEREMLLRHADMLLAGAEAMEADAATIEASQAVVRCAEISYAVYSPPMAGQPHLAVALLGARPVLTFAAESFQDATSAIDRLKARFEGGQPDGQCHLWTAPAPAPQE